jgi:DNA ligase-1
LRSKFIRESIPTGENLVIVETVGCEDLEIFKEMFAKWVGDGYEGIILRNTDGLYQTNFRSHDLQKYKEFKEDEFEIVGHKEGEGRDKGTVLWVCKTPEGRTFSVRPRGSVASRKELFENYEKYMGKKLTVIYQELSEMNVPRFPVGKDIREHY